MSKKRHYKVSVTIAWFGREYAVVKPLVLHSKQLKSYFLAESAEAPSFGHSSIPDVSAVRWRYTTHHKGLGCSARVLWKDRLTRA